MIGGRPLYDNAADAAYFVEPAGFATIRTALDRRLNVAVPGDRGGGKTTVLRQLERELREDGRRVAYVDATALDDASELAVRIRDAVAGPPRELETPVARTLRAVTGEPRPAPGDATRRLLAEIEAINQADPAVVLVDASASGKAVHGLFGRMRDAVWQGPHAWVVALDRGERSTALAPPADAFFDVVQPLPPVDPEPLGEILRRRSPDVPADHLGQLAADARGNPRRAIRGLIHLELGDDGRRPLRVQRALEAQARDLGTPHAALIAEVAERGQVTASDRELQATLGVGRGRLTQVLRELLDRGLVTAERGRSDGPGAPRTYYRLAEDA